MNSSYIQDSSRRGWFLDRFPCISCGAPLVCAWECAQCTCPRWICTCPRLGWQCTGNKRSARRTIRIIDESERKTSSRKLWISPWRPCCSSLVFVWFLVEMRLNLTCSIWNQRLVQISCSLSPKECSACSRNCNECLKYKSLDSVWHSDISNDISKCRARWRLLFMKWKGSFTSPWDDHFPFTERSGDLAQ